MYWFLFVNFFSIIQYLLLSLCWVVGGWLLVAQLFNLKPVERLIVGLAVGWILSITLTNLLAPVLTLAGGSWAASILILFGGAFLSWRSSKKTKIPWKDYQYWPQLAWLAGLSVLFEMIQRGLAIFDDYLHLPIVSAIAAGDLPLHFPLNPTQEFAYHYGLQVWAAGMVRLANATPWFAWDMAKAFALALTVVCGWLWARHWTRNGLVAAAGAVLVGFGGGAFWLILMMPGGLVQMLTASSQLVNSAADTAPTIVQALTSPWVLAGGGPFPFPFAFINGIFVPAISQFANTGAMIYVTILILLLLVSGPRLSWFAALVVGLILASMALSAEHLFFFLWIGIALALAVTAIRYKSWWGNDRNKWWAALALSGVLSLVQGGYISVVFHKMLASILGLSASSAFTETIGLRWPPALVSQKLGALSLLDPRQVVLLLLDFGPVVLLVPIIIYLTTHWIKKSIWIPAGLGLASFFCLVIPAFIQYGVEPSMVRFPFTAAWLWLFLGIPALIYWLHKARGLRQTVLGVGYLVTIFSGLVVFAVQLISIQAPQFSYYIQSIDAVVAQQYWNRLEPGAQVLSSDPSLSVAVFGREVISNSSMYVVLPSWSQLIANPDPAVAAQAGIDYIYMDTRWWSKLNADQKAALQGACVKVVGDWHQSDTFRELFDVKACK